jgi:hypothetical protein
MVGHLVRISSETLPPEISRGFRENGITEESLKIKTSMAPRNSIIENLLKAQIQLAKGSSLASACALLKVGNSALDGMTQAGNLKPNLIQPNILYKTLDVKGGGGRDGVTPLVTSTNPRLPSVPFFCIG